MIIYLKQLLIKALICLIISYCLLSLILPYFTESNTMVPFYIRKLTIDLGDEMGNSFAPYQATEGIQTIFPFVLLAFSVPTILLSIYDYQSYDHREAAAHIREKLTKLFSFFTLQSNTIYASIGSLSTNEEEETVLQTIP